MCFNRRMNWPYRLQKRASALAPFPVQPAPMAAVTPSAISSNMPISPDVGTVSGPLTPEMLNRMGGFNSNIGTEHAKNDLKSGVESAAKTLNTGLSGVGNSIRTADGGGVKTTGVIGAGPNKSDVPGAAFAFSNKPSAPGIPGGAPALFQPMSRTGYRIV